MPASQLTASSREAALAAMSDERGLDILVIGGGVTGAGVVLDAATRGLRVGIVEAQDWSAGTSSRSSGLVHGGLRYLYNLDFKLVREALRERGRLLTFTAPHLVRAQPFLWPLKTPVIERSYSMMGVGMYDALAFFGCKGKTVPFQKHLSKKGALSVFPGVKKDALVGAIQFYDARVDDSRLVLALLRTAAKHGAYAAARAQVTSMVKDGSGRVTGAVVKDLESGKELSVKAKEIIVSTGVWTEETQDLTGGPGGLHVLASKGIHLVVPKDRIKGETGMFLRTEKSVLFIIPWPDYWIIGTTDTPWKEEVQHPVATAEDVEYLLDQANKVLAEPLTREDVITTYAGLRPLLQPGTKDPSQSAKVSREHTVTRPAAGVTAIAGGKLTTYRVMAEDAVDFALGKAAAKKLPSLTATTPLAGAESFETTVRRAPQIAAQYGWDEKRMEHLLMRYGSTIDELTALIDADSTLGEPLASAPSYLRAEAVYGVSHEGALHLEDVLAYRLRLKRETADRGLSAAPEVCQLIAPLLGWDAKGIESEIESYRAMVDAEDAAERAASDAAASSIRNMAADLRPLQVLTT